MECQWQIRWIALCLLMGATLSACGGGSGASPGATSDTPGGGVTQFLPPSMPGVTVSSQSITPGASVSFSASSTDPQNDSITYKWDFGDGETATGASLDHSYATAGTYVAKVTATDQHSLSATGTSPTINVGYAPMPTPTIYGTNNGHFLGELFVATDRRAHV